MSSILDLATWIQWDQTLYLEIAEDGYSAFLCPPESGFNQGDWCGNAGWFPFYPFLIATVYNLLFKIPNVVQVGLLVSNAFFLATLLYVLPLLSRDLGCKSNHANIAFRGIFLALFPSSIFLHAIYPLSIALFAAGLSLHYIYSDKPLQSIPLAFIASMSYPPMIVLSAPTAIYSLRKYVNRSQRKSGNKEVLYWILSVATPIFSYRITQLLIDLNTGVSNSFALVGEKYGHGLHNPLYALKSVLIRASQLNEFSSLQTLFLILCLLFILAKLVINLWISDHYKLKKLNHVGLADLSLFSFAAFFLLLPMVVGGAVSTYRTESLSALALVILIDKLITNTILRLLFLLVASSLFFASLSLFLQGKLV